MTRGAIAVSAGLLTGIIDRYIIPGMDKYYLDLLVLALIVGVLAFVARIRSLIRPPNLEISVHRNEIEVGGSALEGKAMEVEQFFCQVLPEFESGRVRGYWDGKNLKLEFQGISEPGHQARIRYFLLKIL
jgi:hypothetical protein